MHWLVFFLFLSAPDLALAKGLELTSVLKEWNLEFQGLGGFEIKSDKKMGKAANREIKAVAGKSTFYLTRVGDVEAKAASRFISDRKAEVLALYERQFQGYFPVQAKGTVCVEKLKPVAMKKINGGTEVEALFYYASDRLIPGVCLEEQASFKAASIFFYCKERKEVFDLKFFAPVKKFTDKMKEALLSFTCASSL